MNKATRFSRLSLLGMLLFLAAIVFAASQAWAQQGPRLQGQVSVEDQESGRSLQNYSKNVHVVGRNDILNRGMNGNLGWLDDCAYVAAYFGADDPLAGLAVVDVSNPHKPELITIQTGTPGTRESQVEGNADSRMVVVMPFARATPFGDPASITQFQIYDVPGDCTDIIRAGTYDFGDIVTHEHRIWRDKIYGIISSGSAGIPTLMVVDAGDKYDPFLLTTWDLSDEPGGQPESSAHDLDISQDGTRAYVNLRFTDDGISKRGLMILDTSEVANWQPGDPTPVIRQVSPLLQWRPPEDFGGSHSAQLVKIRGRKYLIVQDETFATGIAGRCPWGWARIIDVEDETNPIQISTFRLEVNMRRNCDITLRDNAMYSSHYLGVDDTEEATLVGFTWYSSGLRLVDISDPYDPKEVGYFIPGGTTDTLFQDDRETRYKNTRVDYAYSFVRFHQGNIWFNSVMGGFWVVKYTGKTP